MNDPLIFDTLILLAICIAIAAGIIMLAYGIGGLLYALMQTLLRLAKRVSV